MPAGSMDGLCGDEDAGDVGERVERPWREVPEKEVWESYTGSSSRRGAGCGSLGGHRENVRGRKR